MPMTDNPLHQPLGLEPGEGCPLVHQSRQSLLEAVIARAAHLQVMPPNTELPLTLWERLLEEMPE